MLSNIFSAAVIDHDTIRVESLESFFHHLTDPQMIEDTVVLIFFARGKTTFPTQYMILANQNPCPCGYLGDKSYQCICTALHIPRYEKKITNSLLANIDILLCVHAVKVERLTEEETNHVENSQIVQALIQKIRDRQSKLDHVTDITFHAKSTKKTIKIYCVLSDEYVSLLRQAVMRMRLSRRTYYRVIKLTRIIADLADEEQFFPYIAKPLRYRLKGEL